MLQGWYWHKLCCTTTAKPLSANRTPTDATGTLALRKVIQTFTDDITGNLTVNGTTQVLVQLTELLTVLLN